MVCCSSYYWNQTHLCSNYFTHQYPTSIISLSLDSTDSRVYIITHIKYLCNGNLIFSLCILFKKTHLILRFSRLKSSNKLLGQLNMILYLKRKSFLLVNKLIKFGTGTFLLKVWILKLHRMFYMFLNRIININYRWKTLQVVPLTLL